MYSPDMFLGTEAELAAINDMLSAIGEPPVVTLDEETNADVANARRILARINRQIQAKGWTFNIQEGATIQADVSGLIPYRPTYLSLLASDGATTYINRGGWVYDKSNQNDTFTSITVNLIELKDYDEMPECFRQWIVTKASRQFNSRFFGAEDVERSLAEEEQEARMTCFEYELDYGKYNMLDGDAYVQGILSR